MVKPPKYAQENAKKALQCFQKGYSAMTKVGKNRMKQLANNEDLSESDLMKIYKFKRHKNNAKYKGKPCKDKGYIAWTGWGFGYENGKPNNNVNWLSKENKIK
jgi:hypothetical protein